MTLREFDQYEKFNEEQYLNYSDWIQGHLPTNAVDEWEKWFFDGMEGGWQLGFYVVDQEQLMVTDDHIYFYCYEDDYDIVKLGDNCPPGVGELKWLSVRPEVHHRPSAREAEKIDGEMYYKADNVSARMYVSMSFDATEDAEEYS